MARTSALRIGLAAVADAEAVDPAGPTTATVLAAYLPTDERPAPAASHRA